jgi:hypothetical protein
MNHRTDRSSLAARKVEVKAINENKRLDTHLLTMLSVASGMAGVCATAIGLIGILKKMNELETLVDDLFAIGSVLFLIVSALSFVGLRTQLGSKWPGLVPALDITFLIGLGTVVIASLLLTYMVI